MDGTAELVPAVVLDAGLVTSLRIIVSARGTDAALDEIQMDACVLDAEVRRCHSVALTRRTECVCECAVAARSVPLSPAECEYRKCVASKAGATRVTV